MEYIASALPRVNDRNGKNIVLYLCKNREREVTRQEILDDLNLDMTDAKPEDYSIIGEVKNRDAKKFSKEGAMEFLVKYEEVKNIEKLGRTIAFIFSLSGFTREAEEFCQEKGVAYSDNDKWLEKGA